MATLELTLDNDVYYLKSLALGLSPRARSLLSGKPHGEEAPVPHEGPEGRSPTEELRAQRPVSAAGAGCPATSRAGPAAPGPRQPAPDHSPAQPPFLPLRPHCSHPGDPGPVLGVGCRGGGEPTTPGAWGNRSPKHLRHPLTSGRGGDGPGCAERPGQGGTSLSPLVGYTTAL